MSLIDKVVYYLNDVLISLDIAPTQKPDIKEKNNSKTSHNNSDVNV